MSHAWPQMSRSAALDPVTLSAPAARRFLQSVCADARVPTQVTETALLLVSEVVTNAIVHGDGSPVVDVEVQPDRMRVGVTDDAEGMPRVQPQDDPSEHGWGLVVVNILAARWGVNPRIPAGKSVWFELDRD